MENMKQIASAAATVTSNATVFVECTDGGESIHYECSKEMKTNDRRHSSTHYAVQCIPQIRCTVCLVFLLSLSRTHANFYLA